MTTDPVLPRSTCRLHGTVDIPLRHPGLQLDKFSAGGTQAENQSPALDKVIRTRGDADLFETLSRRRAQALSAIGATILSARTAGSLTLHLSRPSALENAGICLHPVYGFVHLPASGLKGMARAWAETAWKPDQPDPTEAEARIARVLGSGADKVNAARAGSVVFHDAWPARWPRLIRDLVNNHHRGYYQGNEAPGDWHEPVPVSFLAVGPGEVFRFPLSPRAGGEAADLDLAREWLLAALCHRGAGAKTNAGYGAFVPEDHRAMPAPAAREPSLSVELTLAAPGFFAGARQQKDDCDLRPASLRGQLRWWWRTLHAGRLTVERLKALEAQVWGDTGRSGAIRLTVHPLGNAAQTSRARPFDKKAASRGLPRPQGTTVQGLWYASYGMDEKERRHYQAPGERWRVTLSARDTGSGLSPQVAMNQARAALWLLNRHGGVGAKVRKGFGGFDDVAIDGLASLDDCLALATQGLPAADTPERAADSPDLAEARAEGLVAQWPLADEGWEKVLDRAGAVLQDLAKSQPSKQDRVALGLPRQPVRHRLSRHAAPYMLHLGRTTDGTPVLRFAGFPASGLPDRPASLAMLKAFRDRLAAEFGSAPGAGRPAGPRLPCPGEVDGEPVTVLEDQGDVFMVDYGDGPEPVEKHKVVFT